MENPTTSATSEAIHAEADLLLVADTLREIDRSTAVERQLPDVVALIEEHRLAVLAPAGDAVDRLFVIVVVFGIHETFRNAGVDDVYSSSPQLWLTTRY